MNVEDFVVFGLMGLVVFLIVRQQPQTTPQVIVGPSTPQGTSYPVPGSKSYTDPQTGKFVICPTGQVVIDVGDLAPVWACGTPGLTLNYGGQG